MCDESFEIVVHHGGLFKQRGLVNYIGWETTVWAYDPDRWSYFEVTGEIREMGYVNVKKLWYAIENAMYMLVDDKGAINMMHVPSTMAKFTYLLCMVFLKQKLWKMI